MQNSHSSHLSVDDYDGAHLLHPQPGSAKGRSVYSCLLGGDEPDRAHIAMPQSLKLDSPSIVEIIVTGILSDGEGALSEDNIVVGKTQRRSKKTVKPRNKKSSVNQKKVKKQDTAESHSLTAENGSVERTTSRRDKSVPGSLDVMWDSVTLQPAPPVEESSSDMLPTEEKCRFISSRQ